MIRPLTSADAQAAHAILAGGPVAPGSPAWSLEQTASEFSAGGGVGFFRGAELMAFILYRTMGSVFEVSYLATAATHRRQGTMSLLLGWLMQETPVGGEIWLEVHRANGAARALYERLGFREVGLRPRYYADGGDAILFAFPGPI